MDSPYTPISCDIYDELVLLIQKKQILNIALKSGETIESLGKDIFTKNKREYLKLNSGQVIDFAEIQSVNDHRFDMVCFVHES